MERLLVVRLDVQGCAAEVLLNGIALARADAARPRAIVPVHEYTLAGGNRLELVVWPAAPVLPLGTPAPAPLALTADGLSAARAIVLLPRVGNPIDERDARTLAQLDWAPPAGTAYEAPLSQQQDVTLPVSFPRWRWLDAPPVTPSAELTQAALAWLQPLTQALQAGDVEPFIAATRLRSEEIALAYQRRPEEELQRLREHLIGLHEAGTLKLAPLAAESLHLRPLAGGRLLECLDAAGLPALRTLPDADGQVHAWPLRLAAVEGRFYALR